MNEPNIAIEEKRTLYLTDAHSEAKNVAALLSAAPPTAYRAFCGDALGYGDEPEKTVRQLEEFNVGTVGNHDLAGMGRAEQADDQREVERTQNQYQSLPPDLQAVIQNFVPVFKRPGALVFHGSPEDPTEYLMNEDHIARMVAKHPGINLFVGGHLHMPRVAAIDPDGNISFEEVTTPFSRHELDLSKNRYVLTVPSARKGRYGEAPGALVTESRGQEKMLATFYFLT